jgi:hypothetical protein
VDAKSRTQQRGIDGRVGWGSISERSVPVALSVERACQGECRISALFVEAALSGKPPDPMSGAGLGLLGVMD